MAQDIHPAAIDHLPAFITEPGNTDYLFVAVVIFLIVAILVIGNLYFQLHAVPERLAHRTSKVQMEIVAVLTLISLFTHNHLFWIAGLLLAFVQIPDFSTPLYSIAESLGKLSGRNVRMELEAKPEEDVAPHPDGINLKNTHDTKGV